MLGALLTRLGAAATARAVTPGRFSACGVDADEKDLRLEDTNGPWLIMACSFSGKDAEQQAHDLPLELRKRYKLEAFVHKADFKLTIPTAAASDPWSFAVAAR